MAVTPFFAKIPLFRTSDRQKKMEHITCSIENRKSSDFDRLGLGQTKNFVFGDTTFGTENVETFIALHDVTDFADFAANAETRML